MKQIAYMLLVIFCLVFQVAVLENLRVLDSSPNLLFLIALYAALFAPRRDAVIAAWIAGIAFDVFSSGRFGVYGFLFAGAAVPLIYIRDKVFKEHALSQFVLAALAAAAVEALAATAVKAQYPAADSGSLVTGVVVTALWTAVLAPFVLAALVRLNRLLGFAERRSLANA